MGSTRGVDIRTVMFPVDRDEQLDLMLEISGEVRGLDVTITSVKHEGRELDPRYLTKSEASVASDLLWEKAQPAQVHGAACDCSGCLDGQEAADAVFDAEFGVF